MNTPNLAASKSTALKPAISFFERYLTIWVALCIVVGILLGQTLPGVFQAIGRMEYAQVNLPVGVLIWVMIIPMLVKVDFGSLHEVRQHVRGIGVTLVVNWLVWCASSTARKTGTSAPEDYGNNDMSEVVIYHNPDCGTSRNTLAMIRNAGIEPTVIEYLKHPPSRERLTELIGQSGLTVRDALRQKGTPYAELNLDNPALTDDQLLDAMIAYPILINRPFVVTSMDGPAVPPF